MSGSVGLSANVIQKRAAFHILMQYSNKYFLRKIKRLKLTSLEANQLKMKAVTYFPHCENFPSFSFVNSKAVMLTLGLTEAKTDNLLGRNSVSLTVLAQFAVRFCYGNSLCHFASYAYFWWCLES